MCTKYRFRRKDTKITSCAGKSFTKGVLCPCTAENIWRLHRLFSYSLEREREHTRLQIGWIEDYGGVKWFVILWRAQVREKTRCKKVRVQGIREKVTRKERALDGKKSKARDRTRGADWLKCVFWHCAVGVWQRANTVDNLPETEECFIFWGVGIVWGRLIGVKGARHWSQVLCRLPVTTCPLLASITVYTFRRRYRKSFAFRVRRLSLEENKQCAPNKWINWCGSEGATESMHRPPKRMWYRIRRQQEGS
jgi:hypothetical protein